jgi:hypothetical protein
VNVERLLLPYICELCIRPCDALGPVQLRPVALSSQR